MNDPQEQNYSPAAKAALEKLLNRNKPEVKTAMPANPNNLSDETVGVANGWRLLDVDEIRNEPPWPELAALDSWMDGDKKWESSFSGNYPAATYRTRLTRAELRSARGLPPEETAAVLTNEEATAFAVHEATESLRAEVARLKEELDKAFSEIASGLDFRRDLSKQLTTALATVEERGKERDHERSSRDQERVEFFAVQKQLREAQAANVVKDMALKLVLEHYRVEGVGGTWGYTDLMRNCDKAIESTCGQPILNEIDALKGRLEIESGFHKAFAERSEAATDLASKLAAELDAVKKERDEAREVSVRYQHGCETKGMALNKALDQYDTALRSLADANARLASYDEINAELTRMHSEACDQRNEAQRSLATMKDQNAVLRFNFLASQKENSKLSGILINQKQEIELLQKSESATAVLRARLEAIQSNEFGEATVYPTKQSVERALSTTPASDLLADKARLDVIDSEGILIMSSSATQFTVLTGDGESADGTTLRETIDKITAAKTP